MFDYKVQEIKEPSNYDKEFYNLEMDTEFTMFDKYRNYRPFVKEQTKNYDLIYFGEENKVHNFYESFISGRYRPTSPDTCIDPRIFYDEYEYPIIEEVQQPTPIIEAPKEIINPIEKNDSLAKPSFSYAQIITQALKSTENGKMTLSEIYAWIEKHFEYYRMANPVWKNSIRHNLSLNKCFKKVPREPGIRGKGGRWAIDYEFLMKEESKRKRKMVRNYDECYEPSTYSVPEYKENMVYYKPINVSEIDTMPNFIGDKMYSAINLFVPPNILINNTVKEVSQNILNEESFKSSLQNENINVNKI